MKRSISKKLIKNYIFLYILTLILTLGAIIILLKIGQSNSLYGRDNYAEEIINSDYNSIDLSFIKKQKGSCFVVNDKLEVIPLYGEDTLSKTQLTMSEWTYLIGNMQKLNRDFECDIAYNEENKFWLVVKMPVALTFITYFNINTRKDILPEAIIILSFILAVSFLIIFIYICIYSKITSKYFISPLNSFCKMVKDLEEGNYKNRLKVYEDDEFGILADSFNNLADSLENEKNLRKMAEENKKRLILDISHDLKNPLMSIMGSLELCSKDEDLNDKQKHYIDIAYKNSLKADVLIKDLFEYSKLDSPEYKLELKRTEICEYLRMQIAELIDIIEENNMNSQYDIPEKSIYCDIDTLHFSRVINNLIINAVKYNNEDTTINVSLKEDIDNVKIMIQDDGIGIDKSMKEDIFNVFIRGNNIQAQGTGLGLAIVKKIVALHHGNISLESHINKGCTFIITIPKCSN